MTPVFRHGRLRLYLLKLLDEAPRHGYEVIRLLQDRFMGVYAPSPGTIYPRLARLEEEGLVTHDEVDGRKVYRITDKGREEIAARLDDLADLEEEITESVRDIAREVTEDVRDSARQARDELHGESRARQADGGEEPAGPGRERAGAGRPRGGGEQPGAGHEPGDWAGFQDWPGWTGWAGRAGWRGWAEQAGRPGRPGRPGRQGKPPWAGRPD